VEDSSGGYLELQRRRGCDLRRRVADSVVDATAAA
jgi:hypothetical protein